MGQRLLLDTHALIWSSYQPSKLGHAAMIALENPDDEIFVSAVSGFEIANKYRLGKLDEARSLALTFSDALQDQGFAHLPISVDHAILAGQLEIPHRDPFDRLLIAQAQIENLKLVSNEKLFDAFGVIRLW